VKTDVLTRRAAVGDRLRETARVPFPIGESGNALIARFQAVVPIVGANELENFDVCRGLLSMLLSRTSPILQTFLYCHLLLLFLLNLGLVEEPGGCLLLVDCDVISE